MPTRAANTTQGTSEATAKIIPMVPAVEGITINAAAMRPHIPAARLNCSEANTAPAKRNRAMSLRM